MMPTGNSGARRLPAYARRSLVAGGVLFTATLAIGALHTPWGRPLLARLGGCPAARVSATDVDHLRLAGLAGIRGNAPAPARPALGFELDRTTSGDVEAWAARSGVVCVTKKRGLTSVDCQNVSRGVLPSATGSSGGGDRGAELETIEDLALTFNPAGRLVSVDAFTRGVPVTRADQAFSAASQHLGNLLGAPSEHDAHLTVADIARAPLVTTRQRFRFSDYVAILSVSNLSSGLAVREQYLSAAQGAVDGPPRAPRGASGGEPARLSHASL
jgi:hypothetical protein